MVRYINLADLGSFPYILGRTASPYPDTILKLHEFDRGSNIVRVQCKILIKHLKFTITVLVESHDVTHIL